MLFEAIKLALQAIRRNALRSFLTVLGIVIGVAAVIAMVTIGNGTTAKVTADLVQARQQSPVRAPRPVRSWPRQHRCQGIQCARRGGARGLSLTGVRAVAPVAQKSFTVIYGGENRVTVVTGTDLDYFITQDWMLAAGRQFLEGEIRGGRAVCILGQTVREKLFGHTRADRPEHPGQERFLRGDRPAGSKGPVEHGHRSGRRRADAAAGIPPAPRRQYRHRHHRHLGARWRRHRRRCRRTSSGCCANAAISAVVRKTISRSAT